jgi:5-methyltetrahydropteroyltriglutamate--homocysteine methyltransferase
VDRILTTHVGSLLRPPELVEPLRHAERGEHDEADGTFSEALERAVRDVVRRQAEIGIDIVDDGEMGKVGWIAYFYDRVRGIEPKVVPRGERPFPGGLDREANDGIEGLYVDYRTWGREYDYGVTWVCSGPISYDPTALERDIANLRAGLEKVDVVDTFVPAVAPGSAYWLRNEHYATEEEFLYAFADALHDEYTRIVDAGFLVSVDDAVLWHKYATIKLTGGSVEDYRRWAEPRIEALNHALRGIPEERVRYHICSGSNHGPHTQDADLREIIDLVLKVNARAYLIEQGNARHEHEWRIWEDVPLPPEKVIVPGVVTHQTAMVEHPDLVAQRLVRLAKLVGRDRVMAGTDCGFAQEASTRRVPVWTQWAKLESLVEGARRASAELWS